MAPQWMEFCRFVEIYSHVASPPPGCLRYSCIQGHLGNNSTASPVQYQWVKGHPWFFTKWSRCTALVHSTVWWGHLFPQTSFTHFLGSEPQEAVLTQGGNWCMVTPVQPSHQLQPSRNKGSCFLTFNCNSTYECVASRKQRGFFHPKNKKWMSKHFANQFRNFFAVGCFPPYSPEHLPPSKKNSHDRSRQKDFVAREGNAPNRWITLNANKQNLRSNILLNELSFELSVQNKTLEIEMWFWEHFDLNVFKDKAWPTCNSLLFHLSISRKMSSPLQGMVAGFAVRSFQVSLAPACVGLFYFLASLSLILHWDKFVAEEAFSVCNVCNTRLNFFPLFSTVGEFFRGLGNLILGRTTAIGLLQVQQWNSGICVPKHGSFQHYGKSAFIVCSKRPWQASLGGTITQHSDCDQFREDRVDGKSSEINSNGWSPHWNCWEKSHKSEQNFYHSVQTFRELHWNVTY